MNGTFRYFKPERQAIEEENIFRREQAKMQGQLPTERFRINGVLIGSEEHNAELLKSVGKPAPL